MQKVLSRRSFLRRTATAACVASCLPASLRAARSVEPAHLNFPLIDFHVHLDNSTIDNVVELSKERGIKFGVVEHAGTKENKYPVVLSNDTELARYLQMLSGKPVFKGVQTEWTDWASGFSTKALAQLDFVLTDAMTFPGKNRERVKLWEPGVEERVDMADKQKWMDRYVDWYVEILTQQPVDILANTSWLPAPLVADYDSYWTTARVKKVVAAAVKNTVALEISSKFKLPKLSFLKIAKAAGVKFSFGSNGRYPDMGKLDYSIEMAQSLKLTAADMFTPAPDGRKAVQRKKR